MNEYAEYNNADEFEQGVPARNLSKDEWDAIPKETQTRLIKSGVYKIINVKKEPKKEGE